MKILRNYFMIFMAVFLAGCSSTKIRQDYNPQTDFSVLKTYDWAKEMKDSGLNDLDMARVQEAVNNQLRAKGYTLRDDEPDFTITAHMAIKGSSKASGTSVGVGVRKNNVSVSGRTNTGTSNTETGTLTLNFSDAQSNVLLWQGSAQAELKGGGTPERREERITTAVTRILKEFPPGQ